LRRQWQSRKVITIIGSSPESFAKAADAPPEAARRSEGSQAHVTSMSAVVEGHYISEYRTTVDSLASRRAVGGLREQRRVKSGDQGLGP
jgi:flavin-binding protein dodecin